MSKENSKNKKLIIVGDSAFAEIAHLYFAEDSQYEVVAFSVEKKYLKSNKFKGLPVYPFEDLSSILDPSKHHIFVAIVYTDLNRLRTRLMEESKDKGYMLASYISKNSYTASNVEIGEHCFIFENNTVQPFVKIFDNVVLWSGNHIGHHSVINSNCFLSSQVVLSGFCSVGEYSFIGVNSTISNNINIGCDNWIGPNSLISKNTDNNALYNENGTLPSKIQAKRFFKIKE